MLVKNAVASSKQLSKTLELSVMSLKGGTELGVWFIFESIFFLLLRLGSSHDINQIHNNVLWD